MTAKADISQQLGIKTDLYDTMYYTGPMNVKRWDNVRTNHANLISKDTKIAIEIGSWVGDSANYICSCLPSDSCLICIDTFLGSRSHFTKDQIPQDSNHRPIILDIFLDSTKHNRDKIIPLQFSSNVAAEILRYRKIPLADYIFLDGSHATLDVYCDLCNYYPMLSPNGVLLGDDYTWDTVVAGIEKFKKEFNIEYTVKDYQYIIRK